METASVHYKPHPVLQQKLEGSGSHDVPPEDLLPHGFKAVKFGREEVCTFAFIHWTACLCGRVLLSVLLCLYGANTITVPLVS